MMHVMLDNRHPLLGGQSLFGREAYDKRCESVMERYVIVCIEALIPSSFDNQLCQGYIVVDHKLL